MKRELCQARLAFSGVYTILLTQKRPYAFLPAHDEGRPGAPHRGLANWGVAMTVLAAASLSDVLPCVPGNPPLILSFSSDALKGGFLLGKTTRAPLLELA